DRYNEFLMIEKGSSKNTLDAYEHDLKRYAEHLTTLGIESIGTIRVEHIRKHIAALAEAGMAASSIARAISSIRGLHKFAMIEGTVKRDVSENLELPKRIRTLPEVLSLPQIEAIL